MHRKLTQDHLVPKLTIEPVDSDISDSQTLLSSTYLTKLYANLKSLNKY